MAIVKHVKPPPRQSGFQAGQPAAGLRRRGEVLRSKTLAYGLVGSALLWASLPPLKLWPLAWLAPLSWLLLIRRPENLPGQRPYVGLWLAGFCFWLAAVHWLRLPHPATSLGWLALSMYLAVYLPLFVGLSRVAVHGLRLPLIVAAPVVWVGLELAQAHMLTGFSMAMLPHSQVGWLELIQVADLAGAYAVSFVMVFAAACVVRMAPLGEQKAAVWPVAPLAVVVAATLVYGHARLDHAPGARGPKIALIQGSVDTEMKHDPQRQQRIYDQYFGLSRRAGRDHADLDLIVWPETMFRSSLLVAAGDARPPEEWTGSRKDFGRLIEQRRALISSQAEALGAPLLLGIDTVEFEAETSRRYNSALLVDRQGGLGPRYDKMHCVMFGEYVPFASYFPWLYGLTPLATGLEPGAGPQAFELDGTVLSASICFESTVPHLIRGHVVELAERGQEPDVLVNLTNDGWFWGSSELDQHLACAVFRAVECRKPFLIAANTGFSAWIDADGRIIEQGPRRNTGVIVADVRLDGRGSRYLAWGDWPAGLCLVGCVVLGGVGLVRRRESRRQG